MDWMQSARSKEDLKLPAPCALWPVDLRLTWVDCGQLILRFQGQYVTICELDYNILQVELQNAQKAPVCVEVGDLCLVEDVRSGRWYRGRVQDRAGRMVDVFLLDHGNILRVEPGCLSSLSDALLMLPPKIVCGFVANVLPVQKCWDEAAKKYFSSLVGRRIEGYVHGLLPNKVLILEVPEVTKDLLRLRLGRHVDTETFLFLVELLSHERIQQTHESVPDLLLDKQIAQEISFKSSSLCDFESILSLGGLKLAVGEKKRVRISAAVKPGLFYCQIMSAVKMLSEISDKLEKVCESKSYSRGNPGENMGLLCAVKGKDERWHRGIVQCLPVNSRLRIAFVDHGYCDSVKAENVLQLPSDFLPMPILTFPCSLSCLDQDNEELKSQQLLLLRDGLLGDNLEVTVEGLSNEPNVYSVSLSSMSEDGQRHCPELKVETVPLNDLRDGSVFEGYVEHVQSPTDFWMRTAQSNERFEFMMMKLSEHFGPLQLHEDVLSDQEPGVLCCAMYEKDLHYYRAQVVKSLENGAEVFFIDFGNTEKVPGMLIKKLPQEFRTEPPFAFSCSLAHVAPLEDVWTISAIEFFRKATYNKTLLAHVMHRRNADETFVVDLYERGTERSKSMAFMMTDQNLAHYWKYSPPTAAPVGLLNEKQKAENRPVRILQQIVTKQDAVTEKNDVVKTFKHQKFQAGSEIRVRCSHIGTPSDFWCQNLKLKYDLEMLMEKLQSFYERFSPVFESRSVCCAIRLQQDGRWYRGCVQAVKTSHAQVILVDYGATVNEELRNLRALAPEFLQLESQVFRCSLYNVIEPVGESVWSEEACALFKDFTSGRNLTCKILSQFSILNRGLYNMADLYTPVQRVSSYLVEKGVAVSIQRPKPILSSGTLLSFIYSSFNVIPGSEELVHCTHVVNPWEIYIQLDRNTQIIDQILKKAEELAEELSAQARPSLDKPGAVCLARYFGDCRWYRAYVWPARSSLHCNVYFVDFGNKQVSEKRNVLTIPMEEPDLLFVPMQALRCRLLGVPEEENQAEVNAWLEKNVLNKELKAKFVSTDQCGHFICEFFEGDVNVNDKVREIMLTENKKTFETSTKAQNKVVNKNKKTPKLEKQSSVKEKQSVKPKNKPVPERALACTRLPKLSDLPSPKITPGFKKVAFISHGDSTWDFFIQMEDDEQSLLSLRRNLNGGSRNDVASQIELGDLVAAEYDEDQALYRAAVISLASVTVTVEFIDYGNTASVDKKKLYILTDRFLCEARLSLHCTLSKSYQDGESFLKQAQGKALLVEFVQDLGQAWEVNVELHHPATFYESTSENSKPNDSNSMNKNKPELQTSEIEITPSKLVKNLRSKCKRRLRPLSKLKCVQKQKIPNKPPPNKHAWTFLNNPTHRIQHLSHVPVQTGHKYVGVAASVTTPGEFCIALDDLFLIMIEVSNVLQDLTQLLPVLPESQLVPRTACLLRDDRRQKWCRAEILSSDPTSMLLNLVDYGHCARLGRPDLHKLRVLPEQLMALPKITYPCLLRGIRPPDEQRWSDQAVIFFQDAVCQKDLHVYFRQFVSEAQWEVDVVIEGTNVAKALVDAGHAAYVDVVLGNRFQQRLASGRNAECEELEEASSEEASTETEEQTTESQDRPRFADVNGFTNS